MVEAKSYRGPCHVEVFDSEYGKAESIVVMDPPFEESGSYELLTEGEGANLYKALAELSQQACPIEDLGDEALGLCYSPSVRAVRLTEQFVRSFGLLEWGSAAGCDCVGDPCKFGRVEKRDSLIKLLERLDDVDSQLDELPHSLTPEFPKPQDLERYGAVGGGLQPWALDLALQFLNPEPPSPAQQKGTLLREKERLESQIAVGRAEAVAEDGHYVSDRYSWLHFDFHHYKNKQVEHFNSVSWILQEALVLRRAVRLWDAIRRYRSGESSDAVASLWRKNREGRLALFDNTTAPLKPRRSILMVLSILELRDMLNKHIADARPLADYVFYPENALVSETDFRKSRPKLSLRPSSPLSAAWLQLFDDILTDRSSGRICQECKEVFDPTRTDKVFCSKRCSNRFHQRELRIRNARRA